MSQIVAFAIIWLNLYIVVSISFYITPFILCNHSVNHVFFLKLSVINITPKKQSYDDTRKSSRDNELQ